MAPKNNLRSKLDGDELDMSMLRLTEIPVDDIAAIPKATKIDLSNNELTSIPQSFSKSLSHTIKIELGSNKIKELPYNFGNLPRLKFLDLYNNQLNDLPLSLANLTSLKYLDLKGNPLKPELAKVVGTCLNIKECQEAAKNLLAHLRKMKNEKERQTIIKAKRDKELEEAKLRKEEIELSKKRAEKKAAKEKRRQDMQKNKPVEPKLKQNGVIENNKQQPKKVENKKIKKASKIRVNKSKGWFSFSLFNILLLLVTSFAVGTCLMLHSEGDLSINGFQKIAWPKIQQNSMKLYNKTRESFTKENIKHYSIKAWKVLQPMLLQAKDTVIIFLLATKEAAISFYETLKTGDMNAYASGLKSILNSCINFSIHSFQLMKETLRQVDWQALIDGVRWNCNYIFERLVSAKESLQNNDTLISYWKGTESFRSNCWNYTLVAKDAVVKVSNDVYVSYYPIVKERAVFAFQSVQDYVTNLVS